MKKFRFLLIALMFLPMVMSAQTTVDRAMSVWARNIVNANFTSTFTSTATNLASINALSNTSTITVTIGWDGATGTDFVWAGDADHTAQNLDLGAIVPAQARVTAIEMVCTEAAVGVTDITFGAGNASAGAQFIVAISLDVLNEVAGIIDPDLPAAVIMDYAAASNVWVIGDPTDNTWGAMTAGKWSVFVTYIKY